jgi:hypothetical protein
VYFCCDPHVPLKATPFQFIGEYPEQPVLTEELGYRLQGSADDEAPHATLMRTTRPDGSLHPMTQASDPEPDPKGVSTRFSERAGTVHFTDTIQLAVREYLSMAHIWSACFFAKSAKELELVDDGLPERTQRHFGFVAAATGATADFLDATVNELITDAREGHTGGPTQHMTPAQSARIAAVTVGLQRPIVEKYDEAAKAAGLVPLTRGSGVGQDVALVLAVKNALTHWVPETVTTYADDPSVLTEQEMEQRLRGLKLALNPFAQTSDPYFPRRAASHELAAWCCRTAIAYVDAYFALFGVPAPYDHIRATLIAV